MAVTEAVAGLDEGGMRRVVDRSVFVEASLGLEGQQCPGGVGSERAGDHLVVIDRMADVSQPEVQVVDRRIVGSGHGRNRSPWSVAAGGLCAEPRPRGGGPVPRAVAACPWLPRSEWPAGRP